MSDRLRSKGFCLLLAALGGLLTGLTLVMPRALGWMEWLSPALAVPLLRRLSRDDESRRRYARAWRGGFVFFFPLYLVVFHWFCALYPLPFAGFSEEIAALVVLVAWFGTALFQSIGMAFCFVAIVLLWRMPWVRRHPVISPLSAAAVLTLAEWMQRLGWFGVPWGRFALGQVAYLPFVQTASLFGCYGITFLIFAVSVALGELFLSPKCLRRSLGVMISALFVGNLAIGGVLLAVDENRKPVETVQVGMVQSNFSTFSKWNMTASEAVAVYLEYMASLSERNVDMILLPETAFPFFLQDYSKYQIPIHTLAREGDMTIFAGAFTYDEEGGEYSSVLTYHADGSVDDLIYNKRRLVPFGEFVPMRKIVTTLIPPLAELNLWENDLSAGESATVVETEQGAFGFLICFDSVFETLARESTQNGAELLLLATNDSWFLDSAAVYMHLNQARLRAIECGRCVIQAANTGISAIITPTGQISEALAPLEEGLVCGEADLYEHQTLYVLLGNWLVWCCIGLILVPPMDKIVSYARRRLDKTRKK